MLSYVNNKFCSLDKAQISVNDRGYQFGDAVYEVIYYKNGKFLDKTAPLFPGYLFLGTLINPVPWTSVNGTRGISRAVTLDGVYRPVNNHIIEGLQHRCNANGVIQELNHILYQPL